MLRQLRTTALLIATLGIGFPPLAPAWTPYGYAPYGPAPGDQRGYPETGEQPPLPDTEALAPPPAPAFPPGGYGGRMDYPYGTTPRAPYGENVFRPPPSPPGYAPIPGGPRGFPGAAGRDFGPPSGFRISREVSDDAYILRIDLNGMSPDEIQVRTQGQWIILTRDSSQRKVQEDSFEDGRGHMRSYSFSSGTASRRLSVPRDGDLEAMSREEDENSVRIRIPRRGYTEPRR